MTLSNMFRILYRDLERMPNCKSWAKSVRHILQSLGFYEVWLFQTVGDVDIFVHVVSV